jgi:hypothetical protein
VPDHRREVENLVSSSAVPDHRREVENLVSSSEVENT